MPTYTLSCQQLFLAKAINLQDSYQPHERIWELDNQDASKCAPCSTSQMLLFDLLSHVKWKCSFHSKTHKVFWCTLHVHLIWWNIPEHSCLTLPFLMMPLGGGGNNSCMQSLGSLAVSHQEVGINKCNNWTMGKIQLDIGWMTVPCDPPMNSEWTKYDNTRFHLDMSLGHTPLNHNAEAWCQENPSACFVRDTVSCQKSGVVQWVGGQQPIPTEVVSRPSNTLVKVLNSFAALIQLSTRKSGNLQSFY